MDIASPKPSIRGLSLSILVCALIGVAGSTQPEAAVSTSTVEPLRSFGPKVSEDADALAAIDRQGNAITVPGLDADLVHAASGAIFPEAVAAFDRRDAKELGDDERRLSVTYADDSSRAVMFVHVHPSDIVPEADLAAYFSGTVKVLEQQNPSAYLVQSIDKTISVAGQQRRGILGYLEYEEHGVLIGKLLYCYPWNEDYYVQVSSVFPAPIEDTDLAPRIRASERFIADLERVY
jgi:hypothetical protein